MFRYFSKRSRIKRKLRKLACRKAVAQTELDYWDSVFKSSESPIPSIFLYEQAERLKAMTKLKFYITELEKEIFPPSRTLV